ncbi:RluA family pseudouridine synthase [Hyphobacterium marinum]|uniref:Pseudouridine synthase n=1 Tax=Hyphobacterium marinum TaxID=3116574 RepID=A0ABU7LZD7_9PROT|nr:RluA family pseudouridine synthase [Hyphobacterium sp. Y6023]MEE2566908.1 RluA family pseudouridine synthase [Hyphobacterium sp. Y6023]
MSGVQKLTIGEGDDGARLDRWLKKRFPHVPNGRIQKALRKGEIRVDGGRAKADTRLDAGQEVRIPPFPEPSEIRHDDRLSKDEIAYARSLVIYEDADVLAFNKPAGLAVQGGSKTTKHLDRLLSAFGEGDRKPRLVHRLDKDTSGVLVAGKSLNAASKLAKAFQARETEKYYWAVVVGVPRPRTGEIKGFVKKSTDGGDREQMVAAEHGEPGAQYALTRYAVAAEAGQKASWVVLRPITGRTHQLRVHMAGMGYAIVGDRKYTCDRETPGELSNRLHLHARRLVLPLGRDRLVIEAPLPEHMARTFAALGFDDDLIDEAEMEEVLG